MRRELLLLAAVAIVGVLTGAVGGVAGALFLARDARAPAPAVAPLPLPAPGPRQVTVQESSALIEAAREVVPAVVTIINRNAAGQTQATGSGVVVDKSRGLILTNSHVVEEARTTRASKSIEVILVDGQKGRAQVLGHDPPTDVAVLRLQANFTAQATLGDSNEVPLGAQVVAIGSPVGVFQNTVTSGIVSAKGRRLPRVDLRDIFLEDLIQTDAAINEGNSGGPLVWVSTKQVVGLNTLVFRPRGEEGLGFAISSNTVRRVAEELIATGSVSRAFLGISYDDNNPRYAAANRLPTDKGVVILEVHAGRPAAKAGLRPGDVITKINGQVLDEEHPLRTLQIGWKPGDRLQLTFIREGQERAVEVTLTPPEQ